MMTVVVLRMMIMMMLQPVPYHVHLYAGDSSDCGGGGEWAGGGVVGWMGVRSVCMIMYAYETRVCVCVCVESCPGLCVYV